MTNRLTMLHGYAMGILILIGSLVLPQPADAVPAFARQTSMPCTACHFQHFPTLNSFGRSFRAGGYTLTGGQGMIEGDDISLPLMLNASVITKLRYVKSNGNTNVGSDYGVIEWPDEAALLVGGKLAKDAGFLMELGLTDANSFLSTKVHFNVGKAGGTQFSVIPFSTDGLGSAYGFELLNTGAQRSQRPIEDRTGFSAAQALGLGSGEATGIALVYAQHGHELMGWKSPVGEPQSMIDELHRHPSLRPIPYQFTYLTSTTSRGQGQTRKGMSEGNLSAKQRADGQECHIRPTSLGQGGTRHQSPVVRGIR